jgi:hypothetical protein
MQVYNNYWQVVFNFFLHEDNICHLDSMEHHKVIQELAKSRMSTKYIDMVLQKVQIIIVHFYLFNLWLFEHGNPYGEEGEEGHTIVKHVHLSGKITHENKNSYKDNKKS